MLFCFQNKKSLTKPPEGRRKILKGDNNMKGYSIESGYMGYVNGGYMLFASETDYEEYIAENLA